MRDSSNPLFSLNESLLRIRFVFVKPSIFRFSQEISSEKTEGLQKNIFSDRNGLTISWNSLRRLSTYKYPRSGSLQTFLLKR
jgi:hypothetical protein